MIGTRAGGGTGRSWRISRATGTLLGPVALALLVASGAATAAAPATGGHGFEAVGSSVLVNGCGNAATPPAKFDVATGVGQLAASGSAKTCSAANGGKSLASRGSASTWVGISYLDRIRMNVTAVDVNYSLSAKAASVAIGSSAGCPAVTTHQAFKEHVGTNYSWVWNNLTNRLCEATATYTVSIGFEYCTFSASNGEQCTGDYVAIVTNTTGNYFHNYTQSQTFSNPSLLGQKNTTTYGNTNISYGTTASSTLHYSGSLSFPVTWKKGMKLEISATVQISVDAEVVDEPSAHARVAVDAAGTGGGVAITGITFV